MSTQRVLAAALALVVGCLPGIAVGATAQGPEVTSATGPDEVSAPIPTFVDEAIAAGVDHTFSHEPTPEVPKGGFEFAVGGGLAVLDCDDNGLPDLYFAGGTRPASLYRNTSALGGPLRFERIADPTTDLVQVAGAYAVDLEGDGEPDIVTLRRGENVVLRGLGDCRFERANESLGLDPGHDWTTAFSATWEPGSRLPTLAFGNYQAVDDAGSLSAGCSDNRLFRPDAGATTYPPATTLTPGWCSLSMLFSDWDRSGRRDLRVSNDREFYVSGGEEQLWRLPADGDPRLYGEDEGWRPVSIWGMGIAGQDVTGDGYPEYYLTSMFDSRLETLEPGSEGPAFVNIARPLGVGTGRPVAGEDERPSTSWHPEFDDVNNDGRLDLYVSKGNVDAMPDRAAEDPSSLMLGQPDGSWVEHAAEAGVANMARARGAALADLNLDGLLDLVEVNLGAPVEVWRNAGSGSAAVPRPMGNWLAVELEQDGPNRDAIGAWVEVRAPGVEVTRELTVGGGHGSGQLGPVHFGLGEAETAQVRVTWPDGEVDGWLEVAADERIRITRGEPEPVALTSAAVLTGAVVPDRDAGPALPPVAPVDPATCVRSVEPGRSVARLWDEALLEAIRRDFPAPTVHARNLYHLSAAMWDAWAAYDPVADGVFVDERHRSEDVPGDREEAISYAAYRLLRHRYQDAIGGPHSVHDFDVLMASLCYPMDLEDTDGQTPAALGNRIAATIIEAGLHDGSREQEGYEYPKEDYQPINEPLIVSEPGTVMADPDHWQPLALEVSYTQNGQLQPFGPQTFVGQHWGHVDAFALPATDSGVPIDPGPPPRLHDPDGGDEFKAQAVEVIEFSSLLDPRDGVRIDVSPASLGGNGLGRNDGAGYDRNPVTGQPYEPDVVLQADFGRAVAEFWADGPASETPPGHWNTLANSVVDGPGFERRIGGVGPEVDPLEWDVKMYLALNGAVHDAAVAAWGAKGYYDFTRPIAMIRYMGSLGQSSDPAGPSYDPDGLPLVDDLVEVITTESSAPGARHAHLADHVGEIAIRAWSGAPADPETELGGVRWMRAVEWVPYQKATFVTPAFAGYVSGHSTFSRAGAEVLAAITGSPFFPGGLGTWTIPAGSLEFERGPEDDVTLQWATYFDAADQAGISRLYGGIHIAADDLRGRIMGAQCGQDAYALAQRYWSGTARG